MHPVPPLNTSIAWLILNTLLNLPISLRISVANCAYTQNPAIIGTASCSAHTFFPFLLIMESEIKNDCFLPVFMCTWILGLTITQRQGHFKTGKVAKSVVGTAKDLVGFIYIYFPLNLTLDLDIQVYESVNFSRKIVLKRKVHLVFC